MGDEVKDAKETLKEMMNPHTDCLACRVVSSTVLLYSGLYLLQHRNNFGKANGFVQSLLGGGLILTAYMRMFGLAPFGPDYIWKYSLDEKKEKP